MATITRLPSGGWRAQVRRKGCYVSQTFRRHSVAQEWARDIENRIDHGETPSRRPKGEVDAVGHLIDLHVQDMKEVGRAPRRSKAATPEALKVRLGRLKLNELTRERLIQFGRDRARRGAGPVTVNIDFSYLKLVVSHAAARSDRVFPYNGRSIGAAFRRACRDLGIRDLHFHDLRHEAASRLFEAGLSIEQVALVTGHKDWKMLKRYTHLRPEQLYRLQVARAEPQTVPQPAPTQPGRVTYHSSAQWSMDRVAIGGQVVAAPLPSGNK